MDDHVIIWAPVEEFPDYSVSTFGHIRNERNGRKLRPSQTGTGVLKVNLYLDGKSYTRSIKVIVAQAFVYGESSLFDTPVQLDGDQNNCEASNLVWRPRSFALHYTRQFNDIHTNYLNRMVMDLDTGMAYDSIYEAAVLHGLLFKDIWRCIHNERPVPITNQRFGFCE